MSWRDEMNQPHDLTQGHLLKASIVCIIVAIVCLFYVLSAGAQERSTAPLKAALGSYLTLSVVDAQQTASCLSARTCRERNPILKPFAGQPAALTAVKLAANSGVAYGIWKLRRKHPKLALALAMGATGFQASVVAMNARRR